MGLNRLVYSYTVPDMTKHRSSFIINIWRSLQHPQVLFYVLLYFMMLLVGGTIAQKYIGLFIATHSIFNSFIYWIGPFPFPAGASVLTVLFINLLAHFISKSQWRLPQLGTTLAHLSILILLLGGGITLLKKQEGFVVLRKNETTNIMYAYGKDGAMDVQVDQKDGKLIIQAHQWRLPFSLLLQDFKQDYYQGTDIAQAYESDLVIKENFQSWPSQIAMNDPYRYKGYTLYQSSVLTLPNNEIASVLNVVSNPGWLFPYVATGLLFFGLALHAITRRHDKK
jgi:ResB-like family